MTSQTAKQLERRTVLFAAFWALSIVGFWPALSSLVRYSLAHESCSHIILIPLVSAYLVFSQRKRIFASVNYNWRTSWIFLAGGAFLYFFVHRARSAWDFNDYLSGATLVIVLFWMGGFVLFYGPAALKAACFPLMFLLLMVPIPGLWLSKSIRLLQRGSTEVAYGLFVGLGVPVYREGFVLSLPGLSIEVAQECSGIRSSLALVITSLLAGYLLLRSGWTRGILCLVAVPLAVIKNGLRIVTLSLLGIYVDGGFLSGNLHRKGGVVFFILALVVLMPILGVLQRLERPRTGVSGAQPTTGTKPAVQR